jgi:hypothetical protein
VGEDACISVALCACVGAELVRVRLGQSEQASA